MARSRTDIAHITDEIAGKSVSHVTQPDAGRLAIHFTDESVLAIEVVHNRLRSAVKFGSDDTPGEALHAGPEPTLRQREYLEFIARYILRYGVSPAESDIGRHFLLSAPAVNRMVQTLERRGFITRKHGVPRSIAIVDRLRHLGSLNRPPAAGNPRPNKPFHLPPALAPSGRSGRRR
jgi:hypothetical protein